MLKFWKKNQTAILLTLIILAGAYLRLNNFHDLVRLNDDQVRDARIVDKMVQGEEFPLLGPKAGGTKFNIGPAFYYLEYLSALIFGNTPAGIAWIVVILGIASIPLIFVFFNFYFSKNISLSISFLYAISFYAIKYSKFAWNPNLVPFFLLVFLIALFKIFQESKTKKRWYILLGIIAGIGTQLHTILLAVWPVMMAIVFVVKLIQKRKKQALGIFFSALICILINAPLFVYDIKNNGENIKLFFEATEKKTEKNSSLGGNLLKETQFFVQSGAYVISGFEPQKDWTKVGKFLSVKNFKEITVALAGGFLFFLSLFLGVYFFKKEKDGAKKDFLIFLAGIFIVYSMVFFPIANELKTRLFIVCFVFAFIALALVFKFLEERIKNKSIFLLLLILAIVSMLYSNKITYKKAYDFSDYLNKSDIYGGVSLIEVERIVDFIINNSNSKNFKEKKIFLNSFAYDNAVVFLTEKSGIKILSEKPSAEEKTHEDFHLILVGKSKNDPDVSKEIETGYVLLDSKNLGRFTVFLLQNKL